MADQEERGADASGWPHGMAHRDWRRVSIEENGPDINLEIVTENGRTVYRVYGREYDDVDALPPSVRAMARAIESLEDVADLASSDREDGRGHEDHDGSPGAWSREPGPDPTRFGPVGPQPRPGSGGESILLNTERSCTRSACLGDDEELEPDPYLRDMQERERKIGTIFRTLAYLALLLWTVAEPRGMAPFIFLGFMLADFFTWIAEIFLAGVVWRSRTYRLRELGQTFVGFAVMFGLLHGFESFEAPELGLDWARSESMFAFFFTACGKTIAIAARRAAEITRGA